MKTQLVVGTILVMSMASSHNAALAQRSFPESRMFPQQGGEAIFRGVCQDCHMPDAKGATGAGMYPALAHDQKLEIAGYPISVVVHGQKAMPAFGPMFSDQQVADVVNYVRTHFGNHYKDRASVADVKAVRP
jgi:mono/diheme cytochrome c family protein